MKTIIEDIKLKNHHGSDIYFIYFKNKDKLQYTMMTFKVLDYWRDILKDKSFIPKKGLKINVFNVPETPLYKIINIEV